MLNKLFFLIGFAAIINYQEWQINNNFSVRFSDRYADGYFENLSGRIVFDSTHISNASFNVEVTTASINTGNKLKNKHAKSEKWLDAGRFPTISFISDSVYKSGSFYVRGDLRIKDITQKMIIPFKFTTQGDSAVFEGVFKIDRAAYGLGKSTNDEKDSATIWLRVPVTLK